MHNTEYDTFICNSLQCLSPWQHTVPLHLQFWHRLCVRVTSYATSRNPAWQRAGINQLSTKSKTPVNFSRSPLSECGFEDLYRSLMHKDERYYAGKKKKGIFQGENIELKALVFSFSHWRQMATYCSYFSFITKDF